MDSNLVIGLLGKNKSGRSYTWKALFKREVKTGKNLRKLYLTENEYVEVFLINGSAEERRISIEKIIKVENPRIILCSLQYTKGVLKTINYFLKQKYFLNIYWLNPGYSDEHDSPMFYNLGIINRILSMNSIVGVRNARSGVERRVQEIKDNIYGWAKYRNLLRSNKKPVIEILPQ